MKTAPLSSKSMKIFSIAARELITAAGKVLTESDSAALRRLSAELEDRQKEP